MAKVQICVTTIDFLAKIQTGEERVGKRIEEWLVDNLSDFAEPDPKNPKRPLLAKRFYEEFRNGLVHEGRIKNGGQFSYGYGHPNHSSEASDDRKS